MKFVIVTTRSYRGGNVVSRELCRLLEKRHYDARIFISYHFGDWLKPRNILFLFLRSLQNIARDVVKTVLVGFGMREDPFASQKCKIKRFSRVDDDTVVVYHNPVYGNPLHAKKVVRWFLFHNMYPSDSAAFGKDELVFSYREVFNDSKLNPTCRLLHLSYFNSELYRQTNFGERTGNCYYIQKGWRRTDLPKTFDGPIIDELPEREKVAVLNRCKCLYSYDTQTFYNIIASVCGCISIVVMEPGKTKQDYLGEGDSDNGVAYGDSPEEIARALRTRDTLLKHLDCNASNEKAVDYFLQEVEKRFGSIGNPGSGNK